MNEKYIYINKKTGDSISTNLEEEDALDMLPRNNEFAMSLLQQYKAKQGRLSETQLYWIIKLATEADMTYPCSTKKILEVLQKGKISIKFKELDIDLKLYPNGNIVLNGKKVGQYTKKGLVVKGSLDAKILNQFLLVFIKEDPAECFDRIGKKTGSCCYCGITLTHEISKRLGYGPICADKFGRPFPREEYNRSLK